MLTERESLVRNEAIGNPETPAHTIEFEGIQIQWDKKTWDFADENGTINTIDTFSIWNPKNWDEIANRLLDGQICGMYIMGNFGTGEIFEAPEWQERDKKAKNSVILDKIKKRPAEQNLVAFADPEDIIDIIDIDNLKPSMKGFRWAENRLISYAGPQHNIFPVRYNGMVNPNLIKKTDNTVSCFWIPGHWGYEGITNKLKKKTKHGIFGGGSLNIHGKEPCYTTQELRDEFSNQPDWQQYIDFVIFDELAENEHIGRSQTMVSFAGETPQLIRIGSLSPETISERTGLSIPFSQADILEKKVKTASSLTNYCEVQNAESDRRVGKAMDRIGRFKDWYLDRPVRR